MSPRILIPVMLGLLLLASCGKKPGSFVFPRIGKGGFIAGSGGGAHLRRGRRLLESRGARI